MNIKILSTVPTSLKVSKVVPIVSGTEGNALAATDGKYTGTINLKSQTAALTSAEAVTVRVNPFLRRPLTSLRFLAP